LAAADGLGHGSKCSAATSGYNFRVQSAIWHNLLVTSLFLAAPLLLAALGELIGETAGVLNIGLEGMMLCGALAGAAIAFQAGNPWIGLMGAAGAGAAVAVLFAVLTLYYKADGVVAGTGLNLFALGITGTLNRAFIAKYPDYRAPTLPEWYFLAWGLALVMGLWAVFTRTRLGLQIRACGQQPAAAESAGVNVPLVRAGATLLNGALCGVAGAFLTMSNLSSFVENNTNGRGFIALAIVIFGRWNPWGALSAALLFGAAEAAQISLQGHISVAYYPLVQALPYVLPLITLASFAGKSRSGPVFI